MRVEVFRVLDLSHVWDSFGGEKQEEEEKGFFVQTLHGTGLKIKEFRWLRLAHVALPWHSFPSLCDSFDGCFDFLGSPGKIFSFPAGPRPRPHLRPHLRPLPRPPHPISIPPLVGVTMSIENKDRVAGILVIRGKSSVSEPRGVLSGRVVS